MKTKIEVMLEKYNELEKSYKNSGSMLSSKIKIEKLEEMLKVREILIMYLLTFYICALDTKDEKTKFMLNQIVVKEE